MLGERTTLTWGLNATGLTDADLLGDVALGQTTILTWESQ